MCIIFNQLFLYWSMYLSNSIFKSYHRQTKLSHRLKPYLRLGGGGCWTVGGVIFTTSAMGRSLCRVACFFFSSSSSLQQKCVYWQNFRFFQFFSSSNTIKRNVSSDTILYFKTELWKKWYIPWIYSDSITHHYILSYSHKLPMSWHVGLKNYL